MLRLGMSGVDETQGTADDYTTRATYAGLTTNCDVVLEFNNANNGFARCQVFGSSVGPDHLRITSGNASFTTNPNWFSIRSWWSTAQFSTTASSPATPQPGTRSSSSRSRR
ncbi:MAG: hypothetical protein AAGM22_07565 [Acidobacteriota bacterium]